MTTMAAFQRTIQDHLGNIMPGASLTVQKMSDSSMPVLRTAEDGTGNAGNPVIADANGFVRFYVQGGKYRLIASSGAASIIWENYLIGTIQQFDADEYPPPSSGGSSVIGLGNGKIVVTVAANAMTATLKTLAGATPSADDPVVAIFPNGTSYSIESALSLTISAGSTLGFQASMPGRVWFSLVDDGGTLRITARNCYSRTSATSSDDSIVGFMPSVISATAEGGAGAADSAQINYANAAVSSKFYLILGYADWDSGLTTPGTWDASPDRTIQFNASTPTPGTAIQTRKNATAAVATGTTTIPPDNTKPQNTEGTQFLSQAITPGAKQNLLAISVSAAGAISTPSTLIGALFQDSAVDALYTSWSTCDVAGDARQVAILHHIQANTISSTTFKVRLGPNTAATFTLNGSGGSGFFNGTLFSYLEIIERMG